MAFVQNKIYKKVLSGAEKDGNHLLQGDRQSRGAVSIEAALALPVFLFLMTLFTMLLEVRAARNEVRQAVRETAEYMAEYMYLADTSPALSAASPLLCETMFHSYLEDAERTEKYIPEVTFFGSRLPDEEGYVVLEVQMTVRIDLPFFGSYETVEHETIRQKGYTGRDPTENENVPEDAVYVFVAENGVVYHTNRNCSYIRLNPVLCSRESAGEQGYTACRYCGSQAGNLVYITSDGEAYHASPACSRLKRTVYRKKLSEVDLPPCSRCR